MWKQGSVPSISRLVISLSKVTIDLAFAMATSTKPIIVVGAGLVGLTLAQALKTAGLPFEIYDRDGSIDERPAGWGITMHWALPALEACLPPRLFAQLPSIQVDPVEGAKGSVPGEE